MRVRICNLHAHRIEMYSNAPIYISTCIRIYVYIYIQMTVRVHVYMDVERCTDTKQAKTVPAWKLCASPFSARIDANIGIRAFSPTSHHRPSRAS